MQFIDRKAKYPNRWTLVKEDGASEVVTLVRNDEPIVEGTPMNADTLNALSDVAGADVARIAAEEARDIAMSSASNATNSANAAADSETNASQSALSAETSAQAASVSEANAASSEEKASAFAADASQSKESAIASAFEASTSAAAAADSSVSAGKSASAASASAQNAATSAEAANLSQEAAQESETRAKESAAAAKTSEKSAANSEANALKYSQEAGAKAGTDPTLTISGAPADAKAVGDAIAGIALPIATVAQLGGVKIGSGLSVTEDGVLSADSALSAYPVGSIYQSVSSTSPAALFGGTWEEIAQNRVLMGASDTHAAGTTVEAGLPNITGSFVSNRTTVTSYMDLKGAFTAEDSGQKSDYTGAGSLTRTTAKFSLDASLANAVYGASDTVQPAAYYVHVWERMGYLLNIYAEEGTALTITDGNVTIEDVVDDAGRYSRELPDTGTWTVTAVKNGVTSTETLNVRSYGVFTLDFTFEVFGVVWDYSSSSTALTRLTRESDPYGLVTTDITAEPAAAVGTGAGSSPFDSHMPWSGMEEYNIVDNAVGPKYGESGFSRTDNDTLVYIPEFFYRVTDDAADKKRYFYISDKKYSGFEKHPGSGRYIGKYKTGAGYVSESGLAPLNAYRSTARSNVTALDSGWHLYDYAAWCAVGLLYLVEYADWDSQSKVGRGYCDGNSAAINSGATDSMTYHTGRASGTDGKTAVQYRHIENLWGTMPELVDGLNCNGAAIYACTDPAQYADDTATGYTAIGTRPTSTGYISALGMTADAPWAFWPSAVGGSATTYIPDTAKYASGWSVFNVGRYYNDGSQCGMFTFNGNIPLTGQYSAISSRLMFIPPES